MSLQFYRLQFIVGSLFLLLIQVVYGQIVDEKADIVIYNAQILQSDRTFTSAIAIKDQKISALGSDQAIGRYIGSKTKTINAQSKVIIPGLIDSHIHAIRAGLSFSTEVSWNGAHSIEMALKQIRHAAKTKPSNAWIIIAGGWVPEQFPLGILPTKEQLLDAAGNHPLYIQKLYSSVFISPKGFELLGLTTNSELLSRLKEEQDSRGNPTGWWNGNARAISDVFDYLPRPTEKEQIEGTKLFFKELNRHAITGVFDPGGYNFPLEAYQTLWKIRDQKELTIRIAYSLSAPKKDSELFDFQRMIQRLPQDDEYLCWNGIGENVTWGMYNNESPQPKDQEVLKEVLDWAAKEKITATFHWNNNLTIQSLLDVIEQVQVKHSIKDLRWSIAHINNISSATLQKMQQLHLGWLAQNALYFQAKSFSEMYGLDSLKNSPNFKYAIDQRIPIGFGTDAHRVMGFNPFDAIEWLVTGKSVDGHEGRESSQRLDRFTAIDLYTKGSAYFLPDSRLRGELSTGNYADLAILNQNIFTIPEEKIHETKAELTMVGGRVVYKSESF